MIKIIIILVSIFFYYTIYISILLKFYIRNLSYFFLRGEILVNTPPLLEDGEVVSDSYRLKPHGGLPDVQQGCSGTFCSQYYNN